MRTIHRVNR